MSRRFSCSEEDGSAEVVIAKEIVPTKAEVQKSHIVASRYLSSESPMV